MSSRTMNQIMNEETLRVSQPHICPTSYVHYHIQQLLRVSIPMDDNYWESVVPEATRTETVSMEIPTCQLLRGYCHSSMPCLVCSSPLLSAQGLPEATHRSITRRAHSMAIWLARARWSLDAENGDSGMSVNVLVENSNIQVVDYNEYEEIIRRVAEESSMEGVMFRPATQSAIEALEKVKISGAESMQCSICLEELELGKEVFRLPCSHLYHEDCIVPWLETSHMCPLCRFPLPHEDDSRICSLQSRSML